MVYSLLLLLFCFCLKNRFKSQSKNATVSRGKIAPPKLIEDYPLNNVLEAVKLFFTVCEFCIYKKAKHSI